MRVNRLLTWIIAGLASLPAVETGPVSGATTWDGYERTWLAYVPAAATTAPLRPRPILLALHGGGGTGEAMRTLTCAGFEPLAEAADFLVVYPGVHAPVEPAAAPDAGGSSRRSR